MARALSETGAPGLVALGRDRLDLRDPVAAETELERLRPAGVINAAAFTAVDKAESEPEEAFLLNRDGPAALARVCARIGAPLVHVSTDYLFDGTKTGPYAEDDPPAPLGVYGASKAAGEEAVQASGARAAILRTSWVYSATGANFVRTMLRLAAEGRKEVGVVADQIGRPTYAPDLAAACLAALGHEGIFHFAGAGEASWADFAEAIFAAAQARGLPHAAVRRISTADYPTPARRPANSVLSTAKIEAVLGLHPRPWREALELCMDRIEAGGEGA